MKQDRFLLSILVAIGLLVVVSLVLFFFRQGQQNYGPEDTPRGIVRNYVIALQEQDFERAYGYLQEAENKPEYDLFREAFRSRQLDTSNVAVQLGEFTQNGQEAVVELSILHTSSGLFGDVWQEEARALLVQDGAGEWKITQMPFPYWGWDWYQESTRVAPGS